MKIAGSSEFPKKANQRLIKVTKGSFFCLFAAFALKVSAQIPPPVLPAGVGVNIHFVGGHEKDLDFIAAAGFKFIRMDFGWEETEPKAGAYNWASYDDLSLINWQVAACAQYIYWTTSIVRTRRWSIPTAPSKSRFPSATSLHLVIPTASPPSRAGPPRPHSTFAIGK